MACRRRRRVGRSNSGGAVERWSGGAAKRRSGKGTPKRVRCAFPFFGVRPFHRSTAPPSTASPFAQVLIEPSQRLAHDVFLREDVARRVTLPLFVAVRRAELLKEWLLRRVAGI